MLLVWEALSGLVESCFPEFHDVQYQNFRKVVLLTRDEATDTLFVGDVIRELWC